MERIRVHQDAPPTPISHNETKQNLGTFLPGLGYWITAENSRAAHAMVLLGYADYETADQAPIIRAGLIHLTSAEGQIAGFLEVKD